MHWACPGGYHCLILTRIQFHPQTVTLLTNLAAVTVESTVPTKVIRVQNKVKPWLDDQCRLVFDIKQRRESLSMVLRVSGPPKFQVCHREVWWES